MNNNKTNKRFKILQKPLKIMIKIKNEKYMNKEKKEGVVDKMKIDNMIMVQVEMKKEGKEEEKEEEKEEAKEEEQEEAKEEEKEEAKEEEKEEAEVREGIKSNKEMIINKMMKNIIQNKYQIKKMKKKIIRKRKRLRLMMLNLIIKNNKHKQDMFTLKSSKIKII